MFKPPTTSFVAPVTHKYVPLHGFVGLRYHGYHDSFTSMQFLLHNVAFCVSTNKGSAQTNTVFNSGLLKYCQSADHML